MFDPTTVKLMTGAPALKGLDLEALPQQLSDAYAQVVSERIRLRDVAGTATRTQALEESLQRLRRLAYTNEALVSAAPNREDRRAAAFVGGAAHHACLMADRLKTEARATLDLTAEAISPAVSATLLFLIGESTADAAEVARQINVEGADPIERQILLGISAIATGNLMKIVDSPFPGIDAIATDSITIRGYYGLLLLILRGVRALAAELLGLNGDGELIRARDIFRETIGLCSDVIDFDLLQAGAPAFTVFTGPRHLASLLYAVAGELQGTALVSVPPPRDVEGAKWSSLLKEIAVRRPYLWQNHRDAIGVGYLNSGTSSAISFPTGAGKSILSELKIASTLLSGEKVVFLAPTLALVDQTARALKATFPAMKVQREEFAEVSYEDLIVKQLPTITVMTPERCLATIGFSREVFEDVGLVVFDECHLMHPRESDGSRRAIDSMLCILHLTAISPKADVLLLSAMMKNAKEVSEWVTELTGRSCLSLELTWKPTRQIRGCVVYEAKEVEALKVQLGNAKRRATTKNPPKAVKARLNARPLGFFSLRQTWLSKRRDDYTLLRLRDDPVLLGTGTSASGRWYLTPNGNAVAASLAAAAARQGLKTLLFAQTIPLCTSASRQISEQLGEAGIRLTEDEILLFNASADELGGDQHTYLEVKDGVLVSACASHHGLLLASERHLHESLFKRRGGISVLVATSTLAQGMNLPSEVVIISGDSRFDQTANKFERLEAQELLNAAGRAGRAGENSYGFVLLVPSKVVDFNDSERKIHEHWMELQAIFEQSDQCLEIEDPIAPVLDHIHQAATVDERASYLLSRLPIDVGGLSAEDTAARSLLTRSFGAFRARQRNDRDWVTSRISAAVSARKLFLETKERPSWSEELAASTGVSITVLIGIARSLPRGGEIDSRTIRHWAGWFFDLLADNPSWLFQLLRRASLEGMFGSIFKRLESDQERSDLALPVLRRLLGKWIAGRTLAEIEVAFGTPPANVRKCENAREFALRMVPELAYAFGLPGLVARASQGEDDAILPSALTMLGSCMREGVDSPEMLALRQLRPRSVLRSGVHRDFVKLKPFLLGSVHGEDFDAVIGRVKRADRAASGD